MRLNKWSEFSVIISVYHNDNPAWFAQALKSVVEQTAAPTNVIIAQDGPLTVEIRRVIDRCMQQFAVVTLIKSETNVGRGEMLRRAVLACQTELVAIMDADDIADSDRFAQQLGVFAKQPVDVVGSWINEADPHTLRVYASRTVPEHQQQILKFAKRRNPINQMSVMFKKSAVVAVGNYQDWPYFEDMWLWCRMLHSGYTMYNIQQATVTARAGEQMYARRLGLNYAQAEVRLLVALYRLGFYNLSDLLINLLTRVPLRLLPLRLYAKLLNSKLLRQQMDYEASA